MHCVHQFIDRYFPEIAPKRKGACAEIKRLQALKRHPLTTRVVATLTPSDLARYRHGSGLFLLDRTGVRVIKMMADAYLTTSMTSQKCTDAPMVLPAKARRWMVLMCGVVPY